MVIGDSKLFTLKELADKVAIYTIADDIFLELWYYTVFRFGDEIWQVIGKYNLLSVIVNTELAIYMQLIFNFLTITTLNILNELFYLSILSKQFIILEEISKCYTGWIANSADHGQSTWICRLTLVCTGCMGSPAGYGFSTFCLIEIFTYILKKGCCSKKIMEQAFNCLQIILIITVFL
jgi:hypothetical protein